ncbi:MAG: hypothetical protein AB7L09_03250 [Nitrospira sp.]
MYSTDGAGRWWKTEWLAQCETKIIFGSRCQGTVGHEDVHWCYGPSGDFIWDDDEANPVHGGCSGVTPPGHKSYKTPESMQPLHHLRFKTTTEITDSDVINQLEADDPPEGWDVASINRPLSEDDPMYGECERRLEEHRLLHPDEED